MHFEPSLTGGLATGIFWITKRIAQGQFASPKRADALQAQGITHILNVGESPSILDGTTHSFSEIVDVTVIDLQLIPIAVAMTAIDALHQLLTVPHSRVFVHCVAGQNRSPTILWLYLVACGLDEKAAISLIADKSPDAVPGHGRLVDKKLIDAVKSHGRVRYQPLDDHLILEPAY